jgi:hypothetical protein
MGLARPRIFEDRAEDRLSSQLAAEA